MNDYEEEIDLYEPDYRTEEKNPDYEDDPWENFGESYGDEE